MPMKLMYGGLSKSFEIRGVNVVVTTRKDLSSPFGAMVFEEDTNLILTVDKETRFQEQHPIKLMTEIINAPHHSPGTLVLNDQNWYAVVIDINAEPMCNSEWIAGVYIEMFKQLDKRKILKAGIHLLGSIHGNMPVKKSVKIFLDILQMEPIKYTKNINLIVHETDLRDVGVEVSKWL